MWRMPQLTAVVVLPDDARSRGQMGVKQSRSLIDESQTTALSWDLSGNDLYPQRDSNPCYRLEWAGMILVAGQAIYWSAGSLVVCP